MLYVMAREGLAGIVDPVRRDRLPVGKWRPIGALDRYWRRLQQSGDVIVREAEIVPAGQDMPKWNGTHFLREEDIEGYAPPVEPVAEPGSSAAAGTTRAGSKSPAATPEADKGSAD